MPEISRFFGIAIRMHFEDHNPPHFHAVYGEFEIEVAIGGLEVLDGRFPPRALGLAIEWAAQHRAELLEDWELASTRQRLRKSSRLASMLRMIRISNVHPLKGFVVQLTLTDGSIVQRDLSALMDGIGVFERISYDEAAFREVYVDEGTLAWPGDVDIAPETLIWDGLDPKDSDRRPERFLRPRKPR